MNIVSLVMNFLTPDLVAKIASALGLDKSLAQKAIAAAVPSVLSGLTGLAGKPEGARQLANALGQQDNSLLGKFAGMLGGSGQAGLISGGATALSGLLGGGALGSLTGAIAKFAGVGDGPAKSLMGLLGPAVLGTLAKQKTSSNLDASGLAGLLAGQKQNIASAMPDGFAKLLSGTNLLDAIAGKIPEPSTTTTGSKTGSSGSSMAGKTAPAAGRPTPPPVQHSHWPLWLLTAATGGLFYWYFLGDGQQMRAAAPAAPTAAMAPAARSIMAGDVNVGRQASVAGDSLLATLRGITDAASAQAALPKLQDAVAQFNRVNEMAPRLAPDGRQSLAAMVAGWLPTLRPLASTVLALPGLPDGVKAAINGLLTRLDGLAKA